jgi:hypothetical protein
MMDNSYIELNGGYDFNSGEFDFGIGGGGAHTTDGDTAPAEDDRGVTNGPVGPELGDP